MTINNERWDELKDHPVLVVWRSRRVYPAWKELLGGAGSRDWPAPERRRLCASISANNAEELDWVDAALSRHPNMMADLRRAHPGSGGMTRTPCAACSAKYPDPHSFRHGFPGGRTADSRIERQ